MLKQILESKRLAGENYSEFENGRRVYDKDVYKRLKTRISPLDWIFNHQKVVTETIWSHTLLCEEVQD